MGFADHFGILVHEFGPATPAGPIDVSILPRRNGVSLIHEFERGWGGLSQLVGTRILNYLHQRPRLYEKLASSPPPASSI